MTNRLDEEITSALGSMIAEAPEPMELDQLAMQAAIATVPRQRRSPLPAIAVATVVVVVGAISLLASPRDDSAAPLTTVPADTPVTATTPPPDLFSSSGWSRIPYDETVFGEAVMTSVTAGGPGLVAVGTEDSTGAGRGAVWTSPDGIIWSRTRLGPGSLSNVTVGGPGLVAVGWVRSGDDESAAVWTSPDGFTWSGVPHDGNVFGGSEMTSVTAGGPGLVAVGSNGLDAAVWTSPDGFTWSRVPHDETLFGGAEMNSVTVGGPGLVAVGLINLEPLTPSPQGPDGFVTDAAVWTSSDGFTWSRVPHDETVFDVEGSQRMNSVIVGGPGLVAVGSDEIDPYAFPYGYAMDAAVWTSPDGFTWSRVPHDDAVFDAVGGLGVAGGAEMTSVTVGGPGLVAVGEAGGFAVVWTSSDGILWSPVFRAEHVAQFGDKFEGAVTRMSGVVAGGPGLVTVGPSANQGGPLRAVVWVVTLED